MGGRQHDADELFWKVLGLQRAGPVLIPQETLAAAYSQEMGIRDGAPSTGFVGELCIGNVFVMATVNPGYQSTARIGASSRCGESPCCFALSLAERMHKITKTAFMLSAQIALQVQLRFVCTEVPWPLHGPLSQQTGPVACRAGRSPVRRPSMLSAGIRGVLHCTPDDMPLHIFGFNWHNSTWRGHKVRSRMPECDQTSLQLHSEAVPHS